MSVARLLDRAADGERLSKEDALRVYRDAGLHDLARAADAVRWRVHPEPVVTFVVDRNINYTNVCNVYCSFCAFYRPPRSKADDVYTLTPDDLCAKVQELVDIGGTQVLMQGGLNPALGLDDALGYVRAVHARFPEVDIHSFTATEVEFYAKASGRSIEEVLRALRDAGMKSLPGGGAEILVERVREEISPLKTRTATWVDVHRTAHRLGMPTTATMMYGTVETPEERIEHLDVVRGLQDERHGFTAFIPWSYQPENTGLGGALPDAVTYLRLMAVSRLYLDNVANLQSGWVTEGPKVAEVALRFGANDWGGVLMEEQVISAAGARFTMTVEDACRLIRDAGFTPVQRNTYYRPLRAFAGPDTRLEAAGPAPRHGQPLATPRMRH